MRKNNRGFTLIEMLVVIAIIAILVAVIVPTVTKATTKAKAATDAANLRTILGTANTILVDESVDAAVACANIQRFECKSFSGATGYIYYENPGFIRAYYVIDGKGYDIDYFSEVADGNEGTGIISVSPSEADGWYVIGTDSGS